MTDKSELLPCPFCGGEVELRHDHTTDDIDTIHHKGRVPECPLEAGVSAFLMGNENLAAAWNTRASLRTQPSVVVEYAARAICRRMAEINWEDGSLTDVTAWENETPSTRELFRDLAKAALAADTALSQTDEQPDTQGTDGLVDRLKEASQQVFVLERELDITNADHIALYLEANKPLDSHISWLACRIIEAHEIEVAKALRTDRKAVLEEAAKVAENDDHFPSEGAFIAERIRALAAEKPQ